MLHSRIARYAGVSASTVSRVLARAGRSRLSDLQPAEPVMRYEHEAPGDMLQNRHQQLGRIVRPSDRVTGNRRDLVDGAGWEMLFVAIDDHARIAFTAVHSDEKKREAVALLHNAVAYYAVLGVCVKRLLTDNDAAFRPRSLRLPARPWACSTSSQGRTGHRPMARPRGLSSLRCASGPMGERTRTQRSGPMPWRAGSTTTTGTGRAAASAISLRCPGSNLQITS